MLCFGGRKTQRIAPKTITMTKPDDIISKTTDIAKMLVDNKLINEQEAQKQVDAITRFREGKISYAEMRMIAG